MHELSKWNTKLQQFLEAFLSDPDRPPNTLNFYQLDGFVRAVSLVPEFQSMFNWSTMVFINQPPNFKDIEESKRFYEAFFALNNHHVEGILDGKCTFPMELKYSKSQVKRRNIENWCNGFLVGYEYYKDIWNDFIERYPNAKIDTDLLLEPLEDQIESNLYIINTVADSEDAIKNGTQQEDLEGIFKTLEESINLLGLISQGLIRADEETRPSNYPPDDPNDEMLHSEILPFVRGHQKVGRNSPCPCGSGKKFKKCCLH